MTPAQYPHSGRIAALTILALLLAVLWAGPVELYLQFVASNALRLEQRSALLERYRTLLSSPAVEMPRPEASPPLILPETTEAPGIALLQERLKNAATASQVQLRSIQVLRSETLPNAVRIGVRISAAGDVSRLAHLLYSIETARPVLYPDNLQIQSRAATPQGPADALEFQFDVSAFLTGSPT